MGNAKSRSLRYTSDSASDSASGSASDSSRGSSRDSASGSGGTPSEPSRAEPSPVHADPFSKEAVEARHARASRIARKTLDDEAKREADRSRDQALRSRDEAVGRIVDGFMANNAINSAFVPDFVERAIYRNVLTLGLALLEEMISVPGSRS